jgi:hypothetical protein
MAPLFYSPASRTSHNSFINPRLKEANSFEYKDDRKALATIVDNFAELNKPAAPAANVSTSKMPVKLQRTIVELIMDEKKGNDTESLTLTHNDATTTLGDLADSFPNPSPERTALEEYQTYDIATLLSDGVNQYNQEKGTSIGMQTLTFVRLDGITEEKYELLLDRANLAQIEGSQQKLDEFLSDRPHTLC